MTGMSWLSAAKLAMCFVVVALTAGLVHSFEQEQEYRAPREGLNNPILGGTRSVAVRRSGYEGLSER